MSKCRVCLPWLYPDFYLFSFLIRHDIFRHKEAFLTTEENGLKETKLVDINLEELEEQGTPEIKELKEGGYATRLHLPGESTEGLRKCLLNCYDMGGHTEYYNSQQVSYTIVRD